MIMKKQVQETTVERYFRLKMERSEARRKSTKEFFTGLGVFGLILAGFAALFCLTISLAGGFRYNVWGGKEVDKRITELHGRINSLQGQVNMNEAVFVTSSDLNRSIGLIRNELSIKPAQVVYTNDWSTLSYATNSIREFYLYWATNR